MSNYTDDVDVMLMASDDTVHDYDSNTHSITHTDDTLDTVTTTHNDVHDDTHNDDDLVHNDDVNVKVNNKELNEDETLDRDINTNAEEVNEDSLMLTTIDNPHSPKTDYEKWKVYDNENGWYTEEYIARLISMDSEYNPEDDDEFTLNIITSRAINDILMNDDEQIYRLI